MNEGRPRIPNHIKKLQGTFREDRAVMNPVTYGAIESVPTAPADLNEDGAKYYNYVCSLLVSQSLLNAGFLQDIERAAFWYSQFKEAQREMKESGYSVVGKTGWKQVSPAVAVAEKASKFLENFESRYGMSLVASQKIDIPKDEHDEFD